MNTNVLQPLAYIHPGAQIANDVVVEPFATIHEDVKIDEGSWIASNAVIHNGARIGKNVKVYPGAVISSIPQDKKYQGEYTTAEVGDNSTIREFATINRGTSATERTWIGTNVLIMAYAHIAHDCLIHDNTIVANAVNLAGHVIIEDNAIIGGMSAIHQFVKIGRHAILSGGSLVGKDVPPYVKAGRHPLSYAGVNSVGLRRRGYDPEKIREIQEIYRALYLSGMNNTKAVGYIEAHFPVTPEKDEILNFIRNSHRGIMKGYQFRNAND